MRLLGMGLSFLVLSFLFAAAGMLWDSAAARRVNGADALLWAAVPMSVLAVVAILSHLVLEVTR